MTYAGPVRIGSAGALGRIASHDSARAFTWPPVKSVIIVQTVAEVWNDPGGQVCPAVIVAVPPCR